MRIRKNLLLAFSVSAAWILFALFGVTTPVFAENYDFVPNQILVRRTGSQSDFEESLKIYKLKVLRIIGDGALKTYLVQADSATFDHLFRINPPFKVQPNYRVTIQQVVPKPPNDPYYSSEWHLAAIGATPAAWAISNGAGVTVGVMDTGLNIYGNDIAGKATVGYDAARQVPNQNAFDDHGTLVSTTLAATTNNKLNTAAVAPGAIVVPLKICDGTGSITEAALIDAIYYAGTHNIRILNLSANTTNGSFGELSNGFLHEVFHEYAQWYHESKNGLLFVAAGNGHGYVGTPNNYMMVVGAMNKSYRLASFSNRGHLDFIAPGEAIPCTNRAGRVTFASGTSLATPCVAGIAAMILKQRPGISNVSVERILKESCSTTEDGYNLPNAERALRARY